MVRFELGATQGYNLYQENEKNIIKSEEKLMSKLTKMILESINYEKVILKRKENINYLKFKLDNYIEFNYFDDFDDSLPLFYPFFVRNSSLLREKLQKYGIYIPLYWPNVKLDVTSFEREVMEKLLPLPIDQRYTFKDLDRMVYELIKIL